MTTTIALNKPYGFLSRFTPDGSKNRPLAELEPRMPADVYPVGRLDADSEGLLVLTSDKDLVDQILSPMRVHRKTYLAQVERVPDEKALEALRKGLPLDGAYTKPAGARLLEVEPRLPPRDPPIRHRLNVPTAWIELVLIEGKNRQARRMTAAVGHPTLRLFRSAIGGLSLLDELSELGPGQWRGLSPAEIELLLKRPVSPTMRPDEGRPPEARRRRRRET